jgi:hypothetical protein
MQEVEQIKQMMVEKENECKKFVLKHQRAQEQLQ